MRDDVGSPQDLQEQYRLIYADRPDQIRAAGGPWAGVARTVEQTTAVLEDGRQKLAQIWRSPAGTAYLTEMDRVVEAMRATSQAARYNDQVMSAAADKLDAIQKDTGVLSTAPIPDEAREHWARSIVKTLDDSYQQSIADFQPVQMPDSHIRTSSALDPGTPAQTTPNRTSSSAANGSVGSAASAHEAQASGVPSWVPTQPDSGSQLGSPSHDVPSAGPQLEGIPGDASTGWGGAPGVQSSEGLRPGVPGAGSTALTPGDSRIGPEWAGVPSGALTPIQGRQVPGRSRLPGQSRVPGRAVAGEPVQAPPGAAQTRAASSSRPGSVIGGMPMGGMPGAPGGSQGWSGYRRPPEPFPTSRRKTAPSVIEPAVEPKPEPAGVSTEYMDEYGNHITIRRPRE